LEIFGDRAEPRGTAVPSLDKIFVQDVFRMGHECLVKIWYRAGRTKGYDRTYDFSKIHQDNHYKCPGAQPITKMKTGQPGSQKLAWGRPHFQSSKVCPSKLLFNIMFISFE
jgi:hypothetical protein